MTDAVSNNLKIEHGVADAINSDNIAKHLLCKGHTCQRFDTDNLTTLSELEAQSGLRTQLIACEPKLKSFLSKQNA